jgi:hypothetical protein
LDYSKYQVNIFDWITNGTGGGRVNAVAGSGKTTTLVESTPRISGTALLCAFNKHIETELSSRLSGTGISCKTIHSIGMGALYRHIGKLEVNSKKYAEICFPFGDSFARHMRMNRDSLSEDAITTPAKARRTLAKLSNMAMMTLTDIHDKTALRTMASMYGIIVPKCQEDHIFEIVPKIIETGNRMTLDGNISFEDMIYYPAINNLRCKEHLWVMVDEAQDLSAAQLAIVCNSLKSRGRMLAVGDPLQSLYGFSGADPWSFEKVGDFTDTDLPLSICYRCSSRIVDLASKIVPQIEARENAPEGIFKEIERGEMFDMVSPGDMVVCRTNSPLMEVVIHLISEGKRACMRGADLMNNMIDIVNNISSTPGYSWARFLNILMTIKAEITIKMTTEGEEGSATMVGDMYDAVGKCYSLLGCGNEKELCDKIRELFRETPESIMCSSIHRAKGLESERVFIVNPHRIRLNWKDQKEWQAYQEQCSEYVAITRAENELYMVREDDAPGYKVGPVIDLPPREERK